MHERKFFVNSLVGTLIFLVAPVASQDPQNPVDSGNPHSEFNPPDLHPRDVNPSNVQIEKSSVEESDGISTFPRRHSIQQRGVVSSSSPNTGGGQTSILNNELRASGNGQLNPNPPAQSGPPRQFQPDFDVQPQPPQPDTQFESLDRPTNPSADPMNELDPNRLMPGFEPRRSINHAPAVFIEPDRPAQSFETGNADGSSRFEPPANTATQIPSRFSDESDSTVATGYQQPIDLQQRNTIANANDVKSLIVVYKVSNAQQSLQSVPTSLTVMLQTTPPASRMSMIQQYWETWFDWATLQNRRSYSVWLGQLPNPRSGPEQSLLQTAKSIAANEILAAEIQLSRSQSKLQQLSRWSDRELLPLPQGDPLVNRYVTHYEWYAQRQRMPWKLKGIDRMLPRTHDLISQRADSVMQAEQARDQIRQASASGQLGIGDVLESGRIWQASLQGFIGTVVSYNQAISDYALTIAPAQNSIDQIVSMLVVKQEPEVKVAMRNSILQRNDQPALSTGPGDSAVTEPAFQRQPLTNPPTFRSPEPGATNRNQTLPTFNPGPPIQSKSEGSNQFNNGGSFGGG